MKALFPLFLLLMIFSGCGKELRSSKSSYVRQNVSAIYKSSALSINVFFEPGAEPYTEGVANYQLWNLFENNLNSLFDGRQVEPLITVPKTLAQMTMIPSKNKAKWSIEDVLSLSRTVNVQEPSGTLAFKIFFVNGTSEDGFGVIAFHITGTRVMVVFKDVIKAMSNGNPFVPRYVEQATLIHEMGHALGLVDNGLKMITNHKDEAHGAHCKNPNCVMFWANEGEKSMMSFAAGRIADPSAVMFDSQCLQDSRQH